MTTAEKVLQLMNEAQDLLGKEPPADMFSAYPYYLSCKDITEILGCSKATANRMMNGPDFPLLRHGKLMRVQREQFFAYIQKHTNQGA